MVLLLLPRGLSHYYTVQLRFWMAHMAEPYFYAWRMGRDRGTKAAFNKPKSCWFAYGSQSYIQVNAIRPSQCRSTPSRISPLTMIHHISHRYMTPAALLFSLYSSKLPVPPSAVAPSSPFLSLSVFASHSSSSAAMICSNRCCWPLAR